MTAVAADDRRLMAARESFGEDVGPVFAEELARLQDWRERSRQKSYGIAKADKPPTSHR